MRIPGVTGNEVLKANNNTSFTNNMPITQERMNDRQIALKYDLKYSAQDLGIMSCLVFLEKLATKQYKPLKPAIKDILSKGILYGSVFSMCSVAFNCLDYFGKKAKAKYEALYLTAEDKIKNIGILMSVNMAAVTGVELLSRNIKEAGKELKLYLPIIAGIGGLGMLWNAYKGCKKENENN